MSAAVSTFGKTVSVVTPTFSPDSQDRVTGWVDQPNIRDSMSILWTSLATIFICTYSMLVLNVPAATDSHLRVVGRRMMWMCIAVIGPEFPLSFAAGQWSRARHSVAAFHEREEYHTWSMRHAFFADMGGFVLHARDSAPFPLNAKQLHWLVINEKIEYPRLTAQELWDKSKQDRFVKLIMAFQTGYFILQCVGRAGQNLAITTLEIDTLAIVVCSLMTSFAWLHKPSEVRIPFPIMSPYSIEEIVGEREWKLTPLDFVDENGPGHSVNVQPFMKMPVIPPERPIKRIPNDRYPTNPYGAQEYFLCLATLIFTAIHVCAWNYAFPSHIEQLLWRVSSMLLFCITAAFWILETMASWTRLGRWQRLVLQLTKSDNLQEFDKQQLRKRGTGIKQRTQLPLPWEFWTIAPLAVVYGVARLYLIAEAFLEFRNMPATAFVGVKWSSYLPHV